MARNEDIQRKLREGIEAARRGERDTARRLLEQVTIQDDRNEVAWLWLASLVNTMPERRACLERVLEINPNNTRAREALQKLNTGGAATPTAGATAEDSVRARRVVQQNALRDARRAAPAADQRAAGAGTGINTSLVILVGTVIAGLLLLLVVLSLLNPAADGGEPNAEAASETPDPAVVALVPEETATETPTPGPTNTFVPIDQITRAATLPPTFTPTFTREPTLTPTPTPEPVALERFDLVYVSLNTGASEPDAYLSNGAGTYDSLLINAARDIAFSADGTQIAFIRDVEGFPQVFVADFGDLENPRQLTSLIAQDTAHPSFSSDGRFIAFSSSHQSASEELWLVNVDGSDLRKLTDNTVIDRAPSWSPTANEIVYISDSATPLLTQIFVLTLPEDSAGESTNTQLTFSGSNYAPAWSQDGQQIVYVSDRFGDPDIYVMDRDGLGSFLVTTDDGSVENRSPSLSADGRWVAYISNRDGETFQTYVISVDGTTLVRVSNSVRSDQAAVFRPVSDLANLRD